LSGRSTNHDINAGKAAATVFIVSASDVVRAGLESLIENDARFTVAGSAADLSELARQEIEGALPDVVVLDGEKQTNEVRAALRSFFDETNEDRDAPAFVVIGIEDTEWLREALRSGIVRATLPHATSGDEIIATIEAVSKGLIALDAETFAALLFAPTSTIDDLNVTQSSDKQLLPVEPKPDALTPREHEVLEMLASGLSNKEIAWHMKISEHTVKFHVASIFAKFDVSTRTEAVMQGIRRGLVML